MNKIHLLTLLLFLSIGELFSQNVEIPDADFLQALIDTGVDTNGDGVIQQSEALARTSLTLSSRHFASMEGINTFTNLTSFSCRNNNLLLEANISGLSNVINLTLSDNPALTSVDLDLVSNISISISGNNSLTNLDIRSSSSIISLTISDSNSLTDLDFSDISSIDALTLDSNNSISSFDFTGLSR